MPLLVDGYNLMYAAGIVAPSAGRGGLERSRTALCRFVAEALDERERASAVIVFDAAGAPPGLPAMLSYAGLTIRFAKGYADADALLEELIAADHTPRRLTVVSSDHRVQRAARRRKAKAVDSDVWYEAALRKRRQCGAVATHESDVAKPPAATTDAEVEFWLSRIVDDAEIADRSHWGDIFPPGYAEDENDE